ncbi:MAG: polysaccharide deacetylase family protein [Methyloceanibacter sp.]|uniref:polysaccharide deacetylase family protein n=1 Tax=Methyloceanibacter sp. TaxID=1965321 RepID=UPI003D6C7D69
MAKVKTAMMKAAMAGLYHTGAHRLLAPYTQGVGVIFTLHHVRPEPRMPNPFAPNRILEVTPEFLDTVLDQVTEAGLDVITLDEAVDRLGGSDAKRFVCFTFDDGYRDNLQYAYPLFKRRGLPFTLYVPTDYPDGHGELWWQALEEIIARADDEIALRRDVETWRLPTVTVADKDRTFEEVYWWLRSIDEESQRRVVRALAEAYGVDLSAECREQVMNWDEIRTMTDDPLVTIGAHTEGHYAIAKLPERQAMDEMAGSADRIEAELGKRPVHFAFPYGDPGSAGPRDFALAAEAGFKTAVTTRKGMLFPDHRQHLTALPRVSLNGDYQSLTYTALYLSGAPFALWNRFQQVNAA